MPKNSIQPTFEESAAISQDAALQQLLKWYPGQHDRILAAYRRRNPHPGCNCPWQHRKAGKCCTIDRLPDRRGQRRSRSPSARGQYREQINR